MNNLLISLILSACGINDISDLRDERKIVCHDYYVNCAVKSDGTITSESIERCENEFDKAIYQTVER